MNVKTYLIEILEYYIRRLKNDSCTMEEMNDALHVLEENMQIHGTISDFAEFYHKPEPHIRATIARKLLAKPKRKVYYPFHAFRKIVPDKWREEK